MHSNAICTPIASHQLAAAGKTAYEFQSSSRNATDSYNKRYISSLMTVWIGRDMVVKDEVKMSRLVGFDILGGVSECRTHSDFSTQSTGIFGQF